MIRWFVTITYDGGNGKFEYECTECDSHLAIAVATRQMFAKCHWLDPKATRITDVSIIDPKWKPNEEEDDDPQF